jgi:CRISPR-associated endonuclease/helicase Cas3
MRVLVEQTFGEGEKWLKATGLENRVGLYMLMGGENVDDWDMHPEKPSILIGTQDMLLSRALNRGYGMSRYRWPMHFGLLNNDCLWVLDEVQLMGNGLATSAQLEAFRVLFGTFGTCRSVWMSATLQKEWLQTVDFAKLGRNIFSQRISESDMQEPNLFKRLAAVKTLEECKIPVSNTTELATTVLDAHQPRSLTLVIVNTVRRSVNLFKELSNIIAKRCGTKKPELILVHSRFRPPDRGLHVERLIAQPPKQGSIAVTTQVVEAGVDVSARVLFTELSPWPSLIQRFGRCNRRGEFPAGSVYWIDLFKVDPLTPDDKKKNKKAKEEEISSNLLPYSRYELEEAKEHLRRLEHVSISSLESYIGNLNRETIARLFPYAPEHVIRGKDMIDLFDTTPDLAGNDVDVSRFIREGEDLDVMVFWRELPDSTPSPEEPSPKRQELCPVPVGELRSFIKKSTNSQERRKVYRWDFLEEAWLSAVPQDVVPGHTYLIDSVSGGYDPLTGWHPESSHKVAPLIKEGARRKQKRNHIWQSIGEHTDLVVREVERLLEYLNPLLNRKVKEDLILAARGHDRGKAHPVFQNAVVRNEEDVRKDWAKAPVIQRYSRKGFRHELASALAMLQAGESDLACYLAAAHHGNVRLTIRSLPNEEKPDDDGKRFARGVWDGDLLPLTDLGAGVKVEEVSLSLEPMELGLSLDGKPSWAERMLNLRDNYEVLGPFRLAFLETLLRSADMIASNSVTLKDQEAEDLHV